MSFLISLHIRRQIFRRRRIAYKTTISTTSPAKNDLDHISPRRKKDGHECPPPFCRAFRHRSFDNALYLGVVAGLTSLLTFLPSVVGFASSFFTSGVVPGFSLVGEPVALGAGVVATAGVGVEVGVFGASGLGGSQAAENAAAIAKADVNIIDLLIVFLLEETCSSYIARTRGRPLALISQPD